MGLRRIIKKMTVRNKIDNLCMDFQDQEYGIRTQLEKGLITKTYAVDMYTRMYNMGLRDYNNLTQMYNLKELELEEYSKKILYVLNYIQKRVSQLTEDLKV